MSLSKCLASLPPCQYLQASTKHHAHRASLGAELDPNLVLVEWLQAVDTALSKEYHQSLYNWRGDSRLVRAEGKWLPEGRAEDTSWVEIPKFVIGGLGQKTESFANDDRQRVRVLRG